MRALLAAMLAGGLVLMGLITSTSASAASTASVSVVHGIPNTPVNVFVNGKSTLPDFKPGTVAGPLQLPAGTYQVTVFPAANTAGTGTPLISANATVTAGQNVTLVAHLTTSGQPTITPFVNDTSTIPAGKARLIVRHTANAPAVDVRADGAVVLSDLTNPNQASAEVAAGTVSADVVLHGTSTVAIGPAQLNLTAGADTIVYAIGSAADKTLSLVVQTVGGLGASPNGVPAGSGGLAAPSSSTPAWVYLSAALGGVLALVAGSALFVRTRSGRSTRAAIR
jgi:hypothetical protein